MFSASWVLVPYSLSYDCLQYSGTEPSLSYLSWEPCVQAHSQAEVSNGAQRRIPPGPILDQLASALRLLADDGDMDGTFGWVHVHAAESKHG
jgi:hypothetical protein